MIPGETVERRKTKCMDCGATLEIRVLYSNAGYYIGFFCDKDGPYSRESGYYPKREDADKALMTGEFGR